MACYLLSFSRPSRTSVSRAPVRDGRLNGTNLDWLRSQRDDGEVARRVAAQVAEDAVGRDALDGGADLVEGADAAEVEPVGRQGGGAGAAGLLLHDLARLQADAHAVHLLLGDALR